MSEARKSRATLHLARATDAAIEVKRLPHEDDAHYAKRCAAIRMLGNRWLRHPQYVFDPRHSVHADVWKSGRAEFLAQVAQLAAADRARNPAYAKAQSVVAAVGGLQ